MPATQWVSILEQRLQRKRDIIVCRTLKEMSDIRRACDLLAFETKGRAARVGFVPTMGALHAGHISLADMARSGTVSTGNVRSPTLPVTEPADAVVASIFVNPTQFAPTEDLSKYPRTWDTDLAQLEQRGVDVVFAPSPSEIYPPSTPYRTFVNLADIDTSSPEGNARPGFFRGVATVVTKLLNIVQPTDAYFGQKDGVQCIVIRTLARDLNLPTRIHIGATVREADGLAMSSRNVYLTPAERTAAPTIYSALQGAMDIIRPHSVSREAVRPHARAALLSMEDVEKCAQQAAFQVANRRTSHSELSLPFSLAEAHIRRCIQGVPEFGELQYVTFSDGTSGRSISSLNESRANNGAVLLSVAVKIGKTRLLDNVVLEGTPNDLGSVAS